MRAGNDRRATPAHAPLARGVASARSGCCGRGLRFPKWMTAGACGTGPRLWSPPASRRRAHWRIAARAGGDARDALRGAEFTESELSGVSTPFWGRRRKCDDADALCDRAEGADAERACGAPTLAADDHESLTGRRTTWARELRHRTTVAVCPYGPKLRTAKLKLGLGVLSPYPYPP